MSSPPPLPPVATADSNPGSPRRYWLIVLFCLVGLPVRTCNTKLHRTPLTTYALTAFIIAASIWFWVALDGDKRVLGLIFNPTSQGAEWWIGLVTYGFFHADWVHLAGNMYFLLLFGRHVECRFGSRRLLGLFLISSMLGGYLHGLFTDRSLIGASSGVFGIVIFFGLLFPRARILWLPFGFVLRLIIVSATARAWLRRGYPVKVYLLIFLGLQFFMVYEQLYQNGTVSALGHLGGAGAGAIIYFAWRRGWIT